MKKTKGIDVAAVEKEEIRTGLSVSALERALLDNLYYLQGRFPAVATVNDCRLALAYTVRDRLLQRWIQTAQTYFERASRTVCYLSAEYLLGPHLESTLVNLGCLKEVQHAVKKFGWDWDLLVEGEEEPGLGNGGLGRLAACFMESLATLEIPSIGYGIRYEFGIFKQEIRDGWQVELTDKWLHLGNPWEMPRPEITFDVKFGGRTELYHDEHGHYRVQWIPDRVVRGTAYDTPILGYGVNTANLLRLWQAEACESFDFQAFNVGDYYRAVNEKIVSETITKVLYPNDDAPGGKRLRLQQQYCFVSCSLQDMIRIHLQRDPNLRNFQRKYAIQLNDTHPAIAVAELMRLLVDVHSMPWEEAWEITQHALAYTNHTLLPEALEKWSLPLFGSLLPRHLEIVYEINHRFLDEVRVRCPGDDARLARMSIIDEGGERYVRMAHLAACGSHAINGVAELHTSLLKSDVLRDFYELWPDKVSNVTNGVTPRRFLLVSNPELAHLITERIGDRWVKDLTQLRALEECAEDAQFRARWCQVKLKNKCSLAAHIARLLGVELEPETLFDIQVKRMHEYKRQLLNVLHIVTLYNRLRHDPRLDLQPRTFIFGGKAAPGYFMAKLIIKLINAVGKVVNEDAGVRGQLRVIFFPNFSVKNGQRIYPAADLSEQISTAGKEASGTGNMKFALNGALTIGTLDGANVEIREEVGPENFFLFGLTAEEVRSAKAGGYNPRAIYESNPELRQVLDLVRSGYFCPEHPDLFAPVVDSLINHDEYMLLADYQSYLDCQEEVNRVYRDPEEWTKRSIRTVARMGKFSSDRAIRDYCERIWKVEPVRVEL